MADGHHTIIVDTGGETRKLCRVFFGKDGSYYVTAPYHSERRARISKNTVTYTKDGLGTSHMVGPDAILEVASLDDDAKALKIAHHPDGFIQFSGHGVTSGRNTDGSPKGIGVQSWPLDRPVYGPAFGVTFRGVEMLEKWDGKTSGTAQVFTLDELNAPLEDDTYAFEVYYFPSHWRRFVRRDAQGLPTVRIAHPARVVLELRVMLPATDCERQAFLAGELYGLQVTHRLEPPSMVAVTTSTGNLRPNSQGLMEGDGLSCMFPADGKLANVRTLDYVLGTEPERMTPPTAPQPEPGD